MMTTVVVEGAADQELIERLLADLVDRFSFKVVKAGGRDAARPLARKALMLHRGPVALVVDADTTDANRVEQQQRDLEDYLLWGAQEKSFKVLQFIPELEVVFFHKHAVLERMLNRPLAPEIVAAGRAAPTQILSSLEYGRPGGYKRLLQQLSEKDLHELRQQDDVATLRMFIEEFGRQMS